MKITVNGLIKIESLRKFCAQEGFQLIYSGGDSYKMIESRLRFPTGKQADLKVDYSDTTGAAFAYTEENHAE